MKLGIAKKLCQLRRDRRGVAYIEFALALPFMLIFIGGTVDVVRMLLLHQKVDKAVFTVGDLITQQQIDSDVCALVSLWNQSVIRDILSPFTYDPTIFQLRVTSVLGVGPDGVSNPAPGDIFPGLEWTWWSVLGGSKGMQLGGPGPYNSIVGNAFYSWPADLSSMFHNERIIMTEMWYRFTPILPFYSGMTNAQFRKVSYMHPRAVVGAQTKNNDAMPMFSGPPLLITGGALARCCPPGVTTCH